MGRTRWWRARRWVERDVWSGLLVAIRCAPPPPPPRRTRVQEGRVRWKRGGDWGGSEEVVGLGRGVSVAGGGDGVGGGLGVGLRDEGRG